MSVIACSEYGATADVYADVVGAVVDAIREDNKIVAGPDPECLVTLGASDLVVLRELPMLHSMTRTPWSAEHSFRRTSAMCVPPWLERRSTEAHGDGSCGASPISLVPYERLWTDDVPRGAFVAVTYFQLSRLARLCAPIVPDGDTTAPSSCASIAVGHMADANAAAWGTAQRFIERLQGGRTASTTRISLAVGLDSVDVVVILRSPRIDHLGAIVSAWRLAELGSVFPFDEPVGRRLRKMLGVTGGIQDLPSAWCAAKLFRSSTTLLGARLDPDQNYSTCETPGDEVIAAQRAVAISRLKSTAGAMSGAAKFADAIGRFGKITGDAVRELSDEPVYRVFGHYDMMAPWSTTATVPTPSPSAIPLMAVDIIARLHGLAGVDGATPGVATSTDIAVDTGMTRADLEDQPAPVLEHALDRMFQRFREERLAVPKGGDKEQERTASWVSRWLNAAHKETLPFHLSDSVRALIEMVVGEVDEDLDAFCGILPALSVFTAWADTPRRGDGQPSSADPSEVQLLTAENLGDYYAHVAEIAASRARRDRPDAIPGISVAFETPAGHRVARDAFAAYTSAVVEALAGPDGHRVFVSDSAAHPTSNVSGRGVPTIVRVSPRGLLIPALWAPAHEIAESLRYSNPASRTAYKEQQAALRVALSAWVRQERLARAFIDGIEEAQADRCHFEAMRGTASSADDENWQARFWFTFAPALRVARVERLGRAPLSSIDAIVPIVRVALARSWTLGATVGFGEIVEFVIGVLGLASGGTSPGDSWSLRALRLVALLGFTSADNSGLEAVASRLRTAGQPKDATVAALQPVFEKMRAFGATDGATSLRKVPEVLEHSGYIDRLRTLFSVDGDCLNVGDALTPGDSVKFLSRGGIWLPEGEARTAYRTCTVDLLLRLDELGRHRRYDVLWESH